MINITLGRCTVSGVLAALGKQKRAFLLHHEAQRVRLSALWLLGEAIIYDTGLVWNMGVMCMNLMQPRLPRSVQALFAHVVPD